jgi:hypothetical protein
MAERYGRGTGRRRVFAAVVTVLVVAGLGWLAWAVWVESTPDVQSGLVRTHVDGPHRVTADIAVSLRTPQTVASCLVQAMAADHSVVGELHFKVGPEPDKQATVRRSMRTERPAVTVNLVGCTTPGQQRPR